MKKKIIILVIAILVIIQFFKPEKNIHPGNQINNITTKLEVPNQVQQIFAKACYDCHSNNTQYPWYSNIQPVAWFLNKHVVEGKEEFNFDEYGAKSLRYQYHKLEETEKMINEDKMPLKSYTIIHRNAALNQQEKQAILDWVSNSKKIMESKYPLDSLIRKK